MAPEILVLLIVVVAAPFLVGALRKSGGGAGEEKIFQAWKGLAKEFGLSMDESTLEIDGEYRGYAVSAKLPRKEGETKGRAFIDTEAEVELTVELSGIWLWGLEIEAVDIESALDHLDSMESDVGVYDLADGFRFSCPPLENPHAVLVSFGAHAHVRELLGEGTKFQIRDGVLYCAFPLKKNARDVIHQVNMAVETARQFDETGLMATAAAADSSVKTLNFARPAVEKGEEEGGGIKLLDVNRLELYVVSEKLEEKPEALDVMEVGTIPEELSEEARDIVASLLESCDDVAMSDRAIRVGRELDPDGDAPTDWVVARLKSIGELFEHR